MGWRDVVIVTALEIVESGRPKTGLFVYSPKAGAGNLTESVSESTVDPFGNTVVPGFTSYTGPGGVVINVQAGLMQFEDPASVPFNTPAVFTFAASAIGAALNLSSGKGTVPADDSIISLLDSVLSPFGVPQVVIGRGYAQLTPGTAALLEVKGIAAIRPPAGATNSPLSIIASSAAGQALFVEQDSNTDHAATFKQAGTGATQAAVNAVSSNPNFSCIEVTGTETARGTIKIAHHGYADGSDSSASGLSIDLQTTVGGVSGTGAQGIFLTSTTDAIPGGNAFTVRYNSSDWFVIKGGNSGAGQGIVGIGVATGHIPSGMLEISQKDTTTFGLAMTAIAAGTDMINLKDSGGNQRFQVNNAGNMLARANAFFATNAIIGSVSSDFGGAGSALTICHSTDPSSNPAAGHVILYVDAAGNLLARTSAGNIRTVAAV